MAKDPRKFKLGLFVLGGLTVLIVATVALGIGQYWRKNVTMYCYFDENVSGLDPGSAVSYRGVKIGDVNEVRLVQLPEGSMRPDAPVEVRCNIYPDAFGDEREFMVTQSEFSERVGVIVARGMRASINWKDISGQKYIALDYYSPSEQPVKDLGVKPKQPYIPTAQAATLEDIQRDLATVAHRLASVDYEEISARLVDLLEITTQRVEAIDVQALAGHAEETMVAIRKFVDNAELHAAMSRMDSISLHTENVTARMDELLSKPELESAIDNAAASMRSVAEITAQLERDIPEIVAKVEHVVDEAESAVVESDVPGTAGSLRGAADAVGVAASEIAGMRADMQRALQEFSRASRSIDRLARALEEDPGAILRGRQAEKE